MSNQSNTYSFNVRYPGLVSFWHIDRTSNIILTPSLRYDLERIDLRIDDSITITLKDLKIIRCSLKRLWLEVRTGKMKWNNQDERFYYNYSLWFEDGAVCQLLLSNT